MVEKNIDGLRSDQSAIFEQITGMMAMIHGLSLVGMTREERVYVEELARDAIKGWDVTVQATGPTQPTTPLQKACAEHVELSQRIRSLQGVGGS